MQVEDTILTKMKKKYAIPEMSYRFKIDVTGKETHKRWQGEFKYDRPNLGNRGRIDILKARLSGGDLLQIDPEVMQFHEAVAHLRYTLSEYPSWWEDFGHGIDMHDGNVISDIFNKVMAYEEEWQKKMTSGDPSDVQNATDVDDPSTIVRTAERGV